MKSGKHHVKISESYEKKPHMEMNHVKKLMWTKLANEK